MAAAGAGALLAAPDYGEAHNNLGVLQRDVGAVPEAIASYERCLDVAPDSRNAGDLPHRPCAGINQSRRSV